MPKYDSLLLNCGGGIINHSQQSKQYRGAAALAIGIGGTGVAALAELKQKVYQQLEPDDPNSAVPTYQHIQFLAIDSDTTDIDRMRGKAKLDRDQEFFSINNPNLAVALRAKDLIKGNASLNWMDIDHIDGLLSTQGAGGVRQVGRYLLISRASNLISIIQAKCTQALEGMTGSDLDVYIFAGISGGTGSGCFLDTCYIVQKALENMGRAQSSNVMGFFFLPDVITSKPQVASQPVRVNYNNGMAASGVLIRHMVLPGCVDDTRRVLDYVSANYPKNVYISIMSQYAPPKDDLPRPINRRITKGEYDRALDYAISKGFENVFIQQRNSADLSYTPDFDADVIFDPIKRA